MDPGLAEHRCALHRIRETYDGPLTRQDCALSLKYGSTGP